jgi:hypothetical protein
MRFHPESKSRSDTGSSACSQRPSCLAEAAADALLPLIMCEQEAFQRTAQELLAGLAGNGGAQQHVVGRCRLTLSNLC